MTQETAWEKRFANAPTLPFDRATQWFAVARSISWRHPLILLLATGVTLLARWQLDLFDSGQLIVLSYLSDAVVFSWVFMGVTARQRSDGVTALAGGWRALRGRWRALMLSSLWGLPAALVSFVVFTVGPDMVKALVLLVGSNVAAMALLLVFLLAAGFATFLLALLPVLAAIQAARDADAAFKVGGLWAFRGLRAGVRPLAVVFVGFLAGCVLAGAGLTYLYGHIPASFWQQNPGWDTTVAYWYPWPGLLVALYLFMALLQPMAQDLLDAADTDLSDEILGQNAKDLHAQRHVGWLLQRAALALRMLAALSVLLGALYAALIGLDEFAPWLGSAVVFYLGGAVCARWAKRTQFQTPV